MTDSNALRITEGTQGGGSFEFDFGVVCAGGRENPPGDRRKNWLWPRERDHIDSQEAGKVSPAVGVGNAIKVLEVVGALLRGFRGVSDRSDRSFESRELARTSNWG